MKPQSVEELKQRVYQTIEIGNRSDTLSHSFDIFLTVNIILNILVMVLQTFEELRQFFPLFNAIEIFTLCVFLIEYALRIWTATCRYPDKPPLQAALSFIFLSGFVAFRMLRVVRVFHLFRINATTDSFHVITSVLYEKRNQIASSIFIIFVLMLASSLCMYSAEHAAQPGAFRNALSGIWWSMSAILTVGYGDIYPITVAGRILGIIISFLGVCVVAIPTGIISAGFVEQARKAEIDPTSLESHISSVLIDVDSLWKGKTVQEVEKITGLKLVVLRRSDVVILPRPDMVIQLKDQILTLEETDLDHSETLQA